MNRLSSSRRLQVLGCLMDGNSLKMCSALSGCSINTATKLLEEVGVACNDFQHRTIKDVQCGSVTWSVTPAYFDSGGSWAQAAMDPHSRLLIAWVLSEESKISSSLVAQVIARVSQSVAMTVPGQGALGVENERRRVGALCADVVELDTTEPRVEGRRLKAKRLQAAALSLHTMRHNFCRIVHDSKQTPAMRAGIANHVWSTQEILLVSERS